MKHKNNFLGESFGSYILPYSTQLSLSYLMLVFQLQHYYVHHHTVQSEFIDSPFKNVSSLLIRICFRFRTIHFVIQKEWFQQKL